MNDDIPFEHQMMFIVKDYDRKVEENMELRKEVEELSAALEKQASLFQKCLVQVRSKIRHLLAMVEVPGLRDLEQRISEALKKCDE